jgi:hypothetical protein
MTSLPMTSAKRCRFVKKYYRHQADTPLPNDIIRLDSRLISQISPPIAQESDSPRLPRVLKVHHGQTSELLRIINSAEINACTT